MHLSLVASCINLWHDHTSKKKEKGRCKLAVQCSCNEKAITGQHPFPVLFFFMVSIK